MKQLVMILAALVLATFTCFGGDTNVAGTWKWSLAGQNGETILKLKQDGEKLTGSYTNQFGKAEIADGSLKDGEITFKVRREFNGQPFIVKYSGKFSGNKINGKCELSVNGEARSLEWEAKRDAAKGAASGNWNAALILSDGTRIEGTLKLKQEDDKLTGVVIRNENETKISDGKLDGDEITFQVIRDRDGRKVTAKYKGKIVGNTLKGKVESDWSGDWQTLDWEGTRKE